jgi:hypothetical protein
MTEGTQDLKLENDCSMAKVRLRVVSSAHKP